MTRRIATAGYILLAGAVLLGSQLVIRRLGAGRFVEVLAGVLFAVLFSIISFRYLPVPFYLWILSIGGFRYIWSIKTPILPDLYLDRMLMIWTVLVFLVKAVAERRAMRRPFSLDLLLLAHALYILTQVVFQGMEFFATWTVCILIPYTVYFLAKNIITSHRQIRNLLWGLLALSVYYNVTSVAEKFDINWLLWPKIMIGIDVGWRGRSVGPFLHAPLFGTIIGILLPIHLYFLATVKRSWMRLLLAVSMLLGIGGLYFTYTRGSWLAGIVALVIAAALNRKAYLRYLMPLALLAPILAVTMLGLAQDKFMKERMENEDTIGSRLGTAVTVLRVWRDHPLFGVGFFQYGKVRDEYLKPVAVPGFPIIGYWQFRRTSIHDIYIGPLAETGLVGAGLQIAIYFMIIRIFFRKLIRRAEEDHFTSYVMPVFGGLMVGYLAGGLAIDYRFFSVVGTLFMLCAGILDGYGGERDLVAIPAS